MCSCFNIFNNLISVIILSIEDFDKFDLSTNFIATTSFDPLYKIIVTITLIIIFFFFLFNSMINETLKVKISFDI